MAGAFHGVGEPDCEIHVGVSGPGVVRAALSKYPDASINELADIIKKTAFKITRMGQLVGARASELLGVPFGIIFTKADKLSKAQLTRSVSTFQQTLLEQWESLPLMFVSSSERGTGRDEIIEYIEGILKNFNKNGEQ